MHRIVPEVAAPRTCGSLTNLFPPSSEITRSTVSVASRRPFPEPTRPPTLGPGDAVRLKFLYPGGTVEILDCTWTALVGLGADGSETLSPWVVIDFEGRQIWKPLAYLVQAELLEAHGESATPMDRVPARPSGDFGYHR